MREFRHPLPFSAPALLACAMLVAGCAAVGPDYRPPDAASLKVPAAWRAAPPGSEAPPGSLATWWRTLGDPVLDALVADALQANRSLAVA
ncbi:MAG TPA: hypothetical protein VLS49_16380, partial [Usitatibacter sp.]|nr:hypothetical protein [Usitatibacter sp.]